MGFALNFLGNEMSRRQEIFNQELVDSLLDNKPAVAYCYSVGPSWGHDGRYDGYIGAWRDIGEGSRGVGSCCALVKTGCGL